jgi:Aspartyl protease
MQAKTWASIAVVASCALLAAARKAGAQNGFVATLPFAADAGTSIYLRVRLNNGASMRWALDSGASDCIIDRTVARKAGLVSRGSRELHGAGKGTVRLDSIRSAVRLDIEGRDIPACDRFGSVDLSTVNRSAPISGILGYEFFARYIVRIDFDAHSVTLYDPKRYRYVGDGDTVTLEFAKRLPKVRIKIRTARRPEIVRNLIVDTGSEDFVDDSTIRRNPKAKGITVSTTGLGKSYEALIGTLDTVRIGRSLFTDVPGVASDVGIVGNGIWSKFVCVFDYTHLRLFLEARRKH